MAENDTGYSVLSLGAGALGALILTVKALWERSEKSSAATLQGLREQLQMAIADKEHLQAILDRTRAQMEAERTEYIHSMQEALRRAEAANQQTREMHSKLAARASERPQ